MKTVIDLMREYVRVSDMCDAYNKEHGADVKPWRGIKRLDGDIFFDHPKFHEGFTGYTFAMAILEGKPLFCGDIVYSKSSALKMIIVQSTKYHFNTDYWTLKPHEDKRTFTLNGVELPCPVDEGFGSLFEFMGDVFFFSDRVDRNKVARAIHDLLTAACDKE